MRIVGLVLILAIGALAMKNPIAFINIESVLFVLGITIGALLLAGVSIPNMFKAIFSGQATPQELLAGAQGWARARIYIVAAGIIGVFVGAVLMLQSFDDPSPIWPAMAVCLLTSFYGVTLGYGIFLPLQHRLEDRAREQES